MLSGFPYRYMKGSSFLFLLYLSGTTSPGFRATYPKEFAIFDFWAPVFLRWKGVTTVKISLH